MQVRRTFAIKAGVHDLSAKTFAFKVQKTMYGGKYIAEGDTIFVFASENEGGPGLIRQRCRDLGSSGPKNAWDSSANAVREEAKSGANGANLAPQIG